LQQRHHAVDLRIVRRQAVGLVQLLFGHVQLAALHIAGTEQDMGFRPFVQSFLFHLPLRRRGTAGKHGTQQHRRR
jgi:hypothetical protein